MEKLISFLGMLALVGIAFLMSSNKRRIKVRIVVLGILLQVFFAFIILPNSPLNSWIKGSTGWEQAPGEWFFDRMNGVVIRLLSFTEEGSRFLFGNLVANNVPVGEEASPGQVQAVPGRVAMVGAYFAFNVLPTIIFFSSLMAVLYYLGIMQKIVTFFSLIMEKTLRTSGAETLSASANIFVGQTEAPLVVKPFVNKMTVSELMVVMVGGFATVAGGVMAAYVGMLKDYFPNIAGHLISASIMSAPAGIVMAKIMIPETGEPATMGGVKIKLPKTNVNVIDAAAAGAGTGLKLALNVGAMLLAFIALIAMINFGIGLLGQGINLISGADPHRIVLSGEVPAELAPGELIEITREGNLLGSWGITGVEGGEVVIDSPLSESFSGCGYRLLAAGGTEILAVGSGASGDPGLSLSLELILGWVFAPVAWLMGVPWTDCRVIGRLLGEKMALNEFVAYFDLTQILEQSRLGLIPALKERSVVIATYALCGFANFSSIAIQLGGIGGIAPDRRHDLARIGMKAMIGGTLAAFMTGTIAGIFI